MDKEKFIEEIKEIVNDDKTEKMLVKDYYIFGIKICTVNKYSSKKVKK